MHKSKFLRSFAARLSSFVILSLLVFLVTVTLVIYVHPFSLHDVVYVSYSDFDCPPGNQKEVEYGSGRVDFQLPRLSLRPETVDDVFQILQSDREETGSESEFAVVSRLVELVRGRLHPISDELPSASTLTPDQLFHGGRNYSCLCSDYARLLNEMLHAFEIPSRVVWLEGHVVVEYYDSQSGCWVFLDPQNDLAAEGPDGALLSVAMLIYSLERQLPVSWRSVTGDAAGGTPVDFDQVDEVRYLNVLLNGECYAFSGETLAAAGRWRQLLKYRSRPSVLVLSTPFDTSVSRFETSLKLPHFLAVQIALTVTVYAGKLLNKRLTADES